MAEWKIDPKLGRYNTMTAFERGLSVLGTGYSWGGGDVGGFDCSGFVGWCFFGPGRHFSSSNAGEFLTKHHFKGPLTFSSSSRQKGDVLWFPPVIGSGDAAHPDKAGHVGWYTADEGDRHGSSVVGTGPVLQSTGSRGVGFWGDSSWTQMARPEEGWGVYIESIT